MLAACVVANAAFPEKPIRVVIGFPAGGPLDQHARLLGERLPDTPTVIEAGLKDSEVVGFYGFLAPAGLARDVTAKLSDAFRQALATPDIRNRMVSQGADPAFLGSEDFGKFLAAEMPRWADAVKKSGARMD